ncbi:MAG: protein-L-isoaspartate(D-aspartate) O-methyltransferase [Novosphingobium sp.]
MKPLTEEHLAIFRRHMVETIDIHFDLLADEIGKSQVGARLRSALLQVPRHLFVPVELAAVAYQDAPLPLGFDKTISQPFIAALMIDLLDVQEDDAVLEIGTGFGYQSAILAQLSRYVWSVEIVEEFVGIAQERLKALGYGNVALRVGDGTRGWPDAAPFSKILVTAAAQEVPEKLLDQLSPGGRLVMPLGGQDVQQISLVEKHEDGDTTVRGIMPARFTPLETA